MKNVCYKIIVIILLIGIAITATACHSSHMREYYSQESNYIIARGTVSSISHNSEKTALYISFSNLSPGFDDSCFKIVGQNFVLVQERGIVELLRVGDNVEFITAPKYFGDGYVMPIVSLSVDGIVLLNFDEGLSHFLEWLI